MNVKDWCRYCRRSYLALKKGTSAVCTIDKEGADKNREESLKNIPTKRGYDRDEFPMAICEEGGAGADIE
jgi:hypothetical protein